MYSTTLTDIANFLRIGVLTWTWSNAGIDIANRFVDDRRPVGIRWRVVLFRAVKEVTISLQ